MEQVDIKFQYTEKEYVKAVRKYLLVTDTIKKLDLVLAIIGVPCALVYFFLASYNWFSILLLVCAVLFTGFIGLQYLYVPVLTFRKTPKFKEEYHLTFTADGILFETATIHSELKWDAYTAFWESEDCYYLVQEEHVYTILPKRAFGGDAEKLAFERMAEVGTEYTKRKI